MNILFINTDRMQQKQQRAELCRLDRKAQRALTTALKDTSIKKHTALKQNIKNDTCIEFRREVLTLLADTTSSGNLFHSWTARTGKNDEQ